MFRSIILSAAAAGFAVGLATTALQAVTTTPLILQAEVYEDAGAEAGAGHAHETAVAPGAPTASATAPAVAGHEHEDEGWKPADGIQRTLYTAVADILMGVAISAVLLGLMVASGETIDARRGLLWGIGGFVAGSFLPSMGLPPELPGTPAADIIARQTWWLATMAASGLGLALLVLAKQWSLKLGGLVLIVLPHIIGAPPPPSHDAAYPAGLAGEFVGLSLAVSAFIWALSGLAAGWVFARIGSPEGILSRPTVGKRPSPAA